MHLGSPEIVASVAAFGNLLKVDNGSLYAKPRWVELPPTPGGRGKNAPRLVKGLVQFWDLLSKGRGKELARPQIVVRRQVSS